MNLVTDFRYAVHFAENHLSECANELVEWQSSGVLRTGKVQELANLCHWAGNKRLFVAKTLIERAALERVARQVNHESS